MAASHGREHPPAGALTESDRCEMSQQPRGAGGQHAGPGTQVPRSQVPTAGGGEHSSLKITREPPLQSQDAVGLHTSLHGRDAR